MTSSAIGEEAFAGFLNLGQHGMLNVESIDPATWHLDKFLHVSAGIVDWVTGRVRTATTETGSSSEGIEFILRANYS